VWCSISVVQKSILIYMGIQSCSQWVLLNTGLCYCMETPIIRRSLGMENRKTAMYEKVRLEIGMQPTPEDVYALSSDENHCFLD
jgi:hypothetical protein